MANLFERLEKARPPTAETAIEQPHRREDPIADTILRTLRQNRPNGLNKRAIIFLFHRNHKAAKLDTALDKLWREGKVRREQHDDGHARWVALTIGNGTVPATHPPSGLVHEGLFVGRPVRLICRLYACGLVVGHTVLDLVQHIPHSTRATGAGPPARLGYISMVDGCGNNEWGLAAEPWKATGRPYPSRTYVAIIGIPVR